MIEICFVCTGNTCRSVMAERIARKKAKTRMLDCKFTSAGIYAKKENISENAAKALKLLGYDGRDRKSVKLGKTKLNVLYVCVTEAHKNYVKSKKVISFKDLYGEVPDPYGQPLENYIQSAKQIEKNVDVLLDKLVKLRGEI